jgi:hypothetical protein
MTGELTKDPLQLFTDPKKKLERVYKQAVNLPKKVAAEAKRAITPKIPKVEAIQDPDPSPTPIMTEEVQAAKARVRKKKKGRRATILAGRMMTGRRSILNTQGKFQLGA